MGEFIAEKRDQEKAYDPFFRPEGVVVAGVVE
jgi:hypothetical protein